MSVPYTKEWWQNLPKSKPMKGIVKCDIVDCEFQRGSLWNGRCTINPIKDRYTHSVCYSVKLKEAS